MKKMNQDNTSLTENGNHYRIKDIDRLLNQYGGQKKDWIKKSSEVLLDKNGRRFEYHWYENANGKFEIKTVPLD